MRRPWQDTTRARRRSQQCEIELTPRRRREVEREIEETYAILAEPAIGDLEELLEAQDPDAPIGRPGHRYGLKPRESLERQAARRRRRWLELRLLLFAVALAGVLWLLVEVSDASATSVGL